VVFSSLPQTSRYGCGVGVHGGHGLLIGVAVSVGNMQAHPLFG
jgi:hypothetical protein